MTNLGFPAAEDPTNKKKINSVKQTATQVFCCRKNDQQHEERRKQPATPSKPVTYTLSAPFTSSHPTLNELEIPVEMVLTSLKQLDINKATGSDGIPVRLLKETADQISPSLTMLFNKSLRLGIFPGRLETREYCTHFQERKERICGELPPYFPSPCNLQSSRVLRSGGSTRSHIPPHQSRTAWLFSW